MEIANEQELTKRLQQPDTQRDAFSYVVNRYTRQLYWQIRRMVFSHDDTNDLLQNTFIKAWCNLDSFKGSSRISTWLYRIALNETLTFLSKQRATQPLPLDDEEALTVQQIESDPYFDGDHAQALFQQAIARLPHKQRIVFNMKYYDELKYEEMSQLLDTSVGSLKASYHLAVKKIEEFLNQES